MHVQNLMYSLWDIHIFLGPVPKESPCTKGYFQSLTQIQGSTKVVAGLFMYPGEWRQKGKAETVHYMKAYSGRWGIAPLMSNLSTTHEQWTSCPGHFNPRKQPWYPFSRSLDGLQSWYKWFWRKENFLPLPGFKPLTVQHIAYCYTDYTSIRIQQHIPQNISLPFEHTSHTHTHTHMHKV